MNGNKHWCARASWPITSSFVVPGTTFIFTKQNIHALRTSGALFWRARLSGRNRQVKSPITFFLAMILVAMLRLE
jgi:hypothetical protein